MGNFIPHFTPAASALAAFVPSPPLKPVAPPTFATSPTRATVSIAAFLNSNSRGKFRLTNRQAARDGAAPIRDIVVRNNIDLHRAIATYSLGELHGITLIGNSFADDDLLLLPATLQRLKLVQCAEITEHGMENLGALHALQELDLSRQRHLTDKGLQALQHLPLQRLDLRDCMQIIDADLTHLPLTLSDLSLRGCRLISDHGLVHLAPLRLSKLTLNHAMQLRITALQRYHARCRSSA